MKPRKVVVLYAMSQKKSFHGCVLITITKQEKYEDYFAQTAIEG
jgi:hypothetical protein